MAQREFSQDITDRQNSAGAQIIPLADGEFLLSWAGEAASGVNLDERTYVQRYRAKGRPVGEPFSVGVTGEGDRLAAAGVELAGGGYVFVGQGGLGRSNEAPRFTIIDRDGSERVPPTSVIPDGDSIELNFSNDILDVEALADGGFVVAWQADRPFGDGPYRAYEEPVYARIYEADGSPRTDNVQLALSAMQFWRITQAANGDIVFYGNVHRPGGYSEEARTLYQRFSTALLPVSDEILLIENHNRGDRLDIAIDATPLPGGGLAFVWGDMRQQGDYEWHTSRVRWAIYGADDSVTATGDVALPYEDSFRARAIIAEPDGTATLFWTRSCDFNACADPLWRAHLGAGPGPVTPSVLDTGLVMSSAYPEPFFQRLAGGDLVVLAEGPPTGVTFNTIGALNGLILPDPDATQRIAASILPNARAVGVGEPATAFASVVHAGADRLVTTIEVEAVNCAPSLPDWVDADFSYRPTSAIDNSPTGPANTPVDIPPGGSQSFIFSVTPNSALPSKRMALQFDCDNTDPALVTVGLNDFGLLAQAGPSADIIPVAATPGNDGIVEISRTEGDVAVFALSAVNIGDPDDITLTARLGASDLPLTLEVCDTTETASCRGRRAESTTATMGNGEVRTYAVYLRTTGGRIFFLPGKNRIYATFSAGGQVLTETSIAVRTP